jgi:hypothetical protein
MSAFQSLAPRPPASLESVHDILGSLVARYRQEEVLSAVQQIPAREAKFRPLPAWVTSALAEAYGAKGIRELYSHQAATKVFYAMIVCDLLAAFLALFWLKRVAAHTIEESESGLYAVGTPARTGARSVA